MEHPFILSADQKHDLAFINSLLQLHAEISRPISPDALQAGLVADLGEARLLAIQTCWVIVGTDARQLQAMAGAQTISANVSLEQLLQRKKELIATIT